MKRLIWLALLAGCGTSTVDASGTYTVAVTNRDNGCNFANWTVGNSAAGIGVMITQSGGNATATVTGGTGTFLDLALGAHAFTGTVDGDVLNLTLFGTRSQTSGNCTYTTNATILATLSGDLLSGHINYTDATNGNPDCTTLTGCSSVQDFNGTRPPR